METSESVVEKTDEQPSQATPEVENAQEDSLDDLLKEFDTPDETQESQETQTAPTVSPDDIAEIRQFRAEREKEQIKNALNESSRMAKEAAGLEGVPDWVFEARLHKEAFDNPKVGQAFMNRDSNPEAWKKVVASIGKTIASDYKTDGKATESWNAVEGAMHSASTSKDTDTPVDFNKMSDSEFMKWKIQNG